MKYCDTFAALLDPYVDGELSGEEAARVREHLESCPGCRRYVDEALAIRAAFPEVEETVVPEGFARGVMAAVRAEEAGKARPARKNPVIWGRVLLPLAACFALVLILRAAPGSGGKTAFPAASDTAAPASMAPAANGSQYDFGGAAPHMETADDVPAELDAASAPSLRMAPTALEAGSVTADPSSPAAEVSGRSRRIIRLTADQAGELLADLPYIAEEDGVRCYQLPGGDFDALLSALAERDVVPLEEEAGTEEATEGYDLVYVTEE